MTGSWTDVPTFTISEFLLARIAEDERTARYAMTRDAPTDENFSGWWLGHYQHAQRHSPEHVVAVGEAHRRIVERLAVPDPHEPDEDCQDCFVLYVLASVVYADHPDYREEWRP